MSEDKSMSDDSTLINPSNVRKEWYRGEWYYSVIDMISELLSIDHKRSQTYWSTLKQRLKKEGNESVTKGDKLKLVAADGKRYSTDVVNTEQALRLIQSIPSRKVEPMKLWLAQVGSERLEDAEDPEEAVSRALELAMQKYQRMGKTDSWIEARIKGIITRKEFVEALRAAVMEAPVSLYAEATDKLYLGLWERTTVRLRGDLNITKNQNPRDHFGEYALIYTRLAEKVATDKLGKRELLTILEAIAIVWDVAKLIGKQVRATSHALGIDLVTEKPLLPTTNQQ